MAGWNEDAAEQIKMAFEKLVIEPEGGWEGGPLAGALENLKGVEPEHVPEGARGDLMVVKEAEEVTVEVVRAMSRLYVRLLIARSHAR